MGLSIEWLSEFIDAFIDGDAKEETEEYDCTETTWDVLKAYAFFPPASAVEGIKSVRSVCLCVCVCVCPLVNALTAEPFDVGSQNLVWGL